MTDVFWVALISAGSAIVVALTTQFLATRAADKQAGRQERREAMQWQRNEAIRLHERKAAKLHELWSHVLTAQSRMLNLLEEVTGDRSQKVQAIPAELSAFFAARQAYAVALIELPALREEAKLFLRSIDKLHSLLEHPGHVYEEEIPATSDIGKMVRMKFEDVGRAYDKLEDAVASEAKRLKISIE